jgi:hypothetical protein
MQRLTLFLLVAVVASCDNVAALAANGAAPGLSFERNAADFEISRGFTPLPSSAVCSVGGGLEQVLLPSGFVATLVASEPSFPDNIDMNTVNETGADPGRYLYRTHEIAPNAAVSVTDLETGESRIVARRADWERFDGIVWTPWGRILATPRTHARASRCNASRPSPTVRPSPRGSISASRAGPCSSISSIAVATGGMARLGSRRFRTSISRLAHGEEERSMLGEQLLMG